MGRVIISAPFGNYLHWPGVVSTLGTYTLECRAGFFKRWWRVLRTVRFARGTVVNQLGLPSPGIDCLPGCQLASMVSIHGFYEHEWMAMFRIAYERWYRELELNLSCPNVTRLAIDEAQEVCRLLLFYGNCLQLVGLKLIAKLPPLRTIEYVKRLVDTGITTFHLCNTIPTPRGGVGGAALKPFSLAAIQAARQEYGEAIHIIGGGGVASVQDAKDYINAGADDVAIGSALFNPLRWGIVPKIQNYMESQCLNQACGLPTGAKSS